jgi:hypothetical protein
MIKKIGYLILFITFIFLGVAWYYSQQTPVKEQYSGKKNERYYQKLFCEPLEGVIEYRLSDSSRVDCLTDKYAIEVDWAKKWAEGIGQSLYYGLMTGKKPAVALIVDKSKDKKYLSRIKKVTKKYKIKLFIIEK